MITFEGGPRISKQFIIVFLIVPLCGICLGITKFFLVVPGVIIKEYVLSASSFRFNESNNSLTSSSLF